MNDPLIINDTIVFGLLAACLGFVFLTSNSNNSFGKDFTPLFLEY